MQETDKTGQDWIIAARALIDLKSTADPCRFLLPVTNDICVGPAGNVFLFGGSALAAAIVAMTRASARELIFANAHFLSYARLGSTLDIAVTMPVVGRNVSQATVAARVDDTVVFTAVAALGERADQPAHQWLTMPRMRPPEECVGWPIWPKQDAGLIDRLDIRLEPDSAGTHPRDGRIDRDGHLRIWVRTIDDAPVCAATLALFADFVPAAAAAALGTVGGGNSLDNSLRIRAIVPTPWVLCDMQIVAVDRGFAHGDVRLFAQDGTLLATAAQSLIIRSLP